MNEVTKTLDAQKELQKNLQGALATAFESEFPLAARQANEAAEHYCLGMDVGAAVVLRHVIPLLAECVDGNPWCDERLRHLLGDLRQARQQLVGDDELELAS